jgi:Ala-tRNA(Pro) deacylase
MFPQLTDELTKQRVEYTVVPHPRTQSALAEARAVGVTAHEVAKTIVVVTDEGYVRAVVPASDRLDLRKLRHAIDSVAKPRLATEAELGAAYPGFELGAVPPFGGPSGDRVVIDERLAREDEVVLDAGTHDRSIKLHVRDLLALSGAEVADVAAD